LFLSVAARVRAQVRSCGICGGQIGTGEGILLTLRFALPLISPIASRISSGTGTIGLIVGNVPSRLNFTSHQATEEKELKKAANCKAHTPFAIVYSNP
jgi:hypothetical protein